MHSERGQSEVVGSILLVAIIVLAMSVIGTIVLGAMLAQDEPVSATIDAEANTTHVAFEHGGGDTLASSDLTVIVRDETDEKQIDFAENASHESFEPGMEWSAEHGFAQCDRLQLWLVHDPTGTVLFDGARWAGSSERCA